MAFPFLAYGAYLAARAIISAFNEKEKKASPKPVPAIDVSVNYIDDEDGRHFEILGPTLPDNTVVILSFHDDKEAYRKSRLAIFADRDGDLVQSTVIQGGKASIWTPFGAIAPIEDSIVFLVRGCTVQGEKTVLLGQKMFNAPWPNKDPMLSTVFRPFIGLCMAIAWSDGRLDPCEIRSINAILKNDFGIPSSENEMLRAIMKSRSFSPVDILCHNLILRTPSLELTIVLKSLSLVVKADGRVDTRRVEIIKKVAFYFNVQESDWHNLLDTIGLGIYVKRTEYLKILGLTEEATASEIKSAFKSKIIEYHPDKYQNLPAEFKEVASQMTIKLTEARNALLQQCS